MGSLVFLCSSFTIHDAIAGTIGKTRCFVWSNLHGITGPQIHFDGSPFLACGQQLLHCQFGMERCHKGSEESSDVPRDGDSNEHAYSKPAEVKKTVVKLQGKYCLFCPVSFHLNDQTRCCLHIVFSTSTTNDC